MSRDTNYSTLFNQLLEVDGPFLTAAVAKKAFGKILPKAEQAIVDEMRVANAERAAEPTLAKPWIRWVFERVLDYDDEVFKHGPAVAHLNHLVGQHAVTLRPDFVLDDPEVDGLKPRLLLTEWPVEQQLDRKAGTDRWNASPVARMVELCRAMKAPLGLVTNGRSWTLVHAPLDDAVSTTTWDAELWLDERETLDLFVTVLGAQRFFGVDESETLESLLAASAKSGDEVTTTLGRQVRRSVELLVSAISEANRERHGELLGDTTPEQIYRGAVTVMMRLVFLLTAEERELLLLGDETYDAHYAVSTLLDQLEAEPDADVLFNRHDAWPRLLATFRLIHGGVRHDDRLNLPAYGGRLFDPERYPFLEGRLSGEPFDGTNVDDRLLNAINNRVMMAVLRSLQWVELKGESRRLSFRHLDVEQIGTVYEGLLDHSCSLVTDTTLGLLAKKSAKGNIEPEIPLTTLEAKHSEGEAAFEKWLMGEHKFSASEIKKLAVEPEGVELTRLRSACANDDELFERVKPFFGILRTDLRGLPEVFLKDNYVVVSSSERSDTGAHYTPRSIAERIVKHALDPLVYEPGPHNEEDDEKWQLRPWAEILDLKIVDPACGSGAMLVSACRYLADRLVEAWKAEELAGGVPLPLPGAEGAPLILSTEPDEWTIEAMRLVAGRCLYGVDINDMAVEMCKLSLWLATLAKGKPFSFLDHSIRHGDSLLGITDLSELNQIGTSDKGMESAYLEGLRAFVDNAKDKRLDLLAMPTVDAHDLEEKSRLLAEADSELESVKTVADAFTGALLSTSDGKATDRATRLVGLADQVATAFDIGGSSTGSALEELANRALYWLDEGRPPMAPSRVPLHWPIAFPEVFLDGGGRFDATVSNPPFLGGKKVSGATGTNYRELLVEGIGRGAKGNADLVAYFFLRAAQVASITGFVATNTVAQGETSEVGLRQLVDGGSSIYRAESSTPWPGDASVEVALVWLISWNWAAPVILDGLKIDAIDEMLYRRSPSGWRKRRLEVNVGQSFQGSLVLGKGFIVSRNEAQMLIEKDRRNADVLFPYLGGEDLNQSPTLTAPRWVINFFDWPESKAREYPDCFEIVEREVKPERLKKDGAKYPRMVDLWWLYWMPRDTLYRTISELSRVVAIARVSKTAAPAFVTTDQVFHEKVVVFPYDDDFHFGVLASGFHVRWALRYSSTLRSDMNYAPSDVFEQFPQPGHTRQVEDIARVFDVYRSEWMVDSAEGLTTTYNRVHEPSDRTPEIVRLRELHVELDHAVADAYGWSDLNLDHGFHPVRGQGVRYTFSPDAAVEVLYRLLELNRTRYEEEVAAGLHAGKKSSPESSTSTGLGTLF